jgi:hypothetical protein
MITRADKGNSLVILPTQQYESKVHNFLQANQFQTISTDPTKSYQTQIRKTIHSSRTPIPHDSKWKYINMNPSAPTIKGLIKLHKPVQPIRPVVNWRSVPAYKLAKLFTQKAGHLTPLPNAFNIQNSRDLIHKMKDTPILPHFTLASLDISNLYTNIPVAETQTILADILKQTLTDTQTQRELPGWYDKITKQNYFTFNGNTMIQKEGLAMGAPSSGLIAEIFLQHIENIHMARLSMKRKIINYFRYVDDILIIFDPTHSSIQAILDDFNTLHRNLQFTAELEENNTINYLDITIQKTPTNWKTAIYRKPTFTDTIIPYTSNHPTQHKYAAVKFLYNRLNTYDLLADEYQQEEDTIHNILYNNSFPIRPQKPRHPKLKEQKQSTHTHTHKNGPHLHI